MCVIFATRVCARACHTNVAYPPFRSPPLSGARAMTIVIFTIAVVIYYP